MEGLQLLVISCILICSVQANTGTHLVSYAVENKTYFLGNKAIGA
jgi:hypothetical protein